jgi:hypothetical protein
MKQKCYSVSLNFNTSDKPPLNKAQLLTGRDGNWPGNVVLVRLWLDHLKSALCKKISVTSNL